MAELYTWPGILTTLLDQRDLSVSESTWAMRQIMSGAATPSQLAGFLVALRAKGETVDEIVGFRDAILEAALPLPVDPNVLDIVGTGGDRFGTVNISTHGGRRRRGIRCSRRQARKQGGQLRVGLFRCAGSPRHRPDDHAGAGRRDAGTRRDHVRVRVGVPPGLPSRRADAGPSSACRRSSTSSGRCATPLAPRPTQWAWRSSTACRSSPASSARAAPPRWCSAATTGSTS